MHEVEVAIVNPTGLHARPAAQLVSAAAGFASDVFLVRGDGGDEVNAKSIMMVLAAGFSQGETAVLRTDGPDEREAAEALSALIAGFED